jgi:hypothetical protein
MKSWEQHAEDRQIKTTNTPCSGELSYSNLRASHIMQKFPRFGNVTCFINANSFYKDMHDIGLYDRFKQHIESNFDALDKRISNEVVIRNLREMLTASMKYSDAHSAIAVKDCKMLLTEAPALQARGWAHYGPHSGPII